MATGPKIVNDKEVNDIRYGYIDKGFGMYFQTKKRCIANIHVPIIQYIDV